MDDMLCRKVNMPGLKHDRAFRAWLNNAKTNAMTWHTKNNPIGDFSDVAVWVDTNGEGSDSDMPKHVWDRIVEAMAGTCGLCWITFLGEPGDECDEWKPLRG